MDNHASQANRTRETRDQLLRAAMSVFAHDGFHGASLKSIAQAAGINQALIAYHFGNKEGLYLAVFERIVEELRARIGDRVDAIETMLQQPLATGAVSDVQGLVAVVTALSESMLDLFTSAQSREWALLISREQSNPSAAFEVIYDGYMGGVMTLLSQLIQRIRPQATELEASLLVITLLGQTQVYRIARTGILRHMHWQDIGPAELNLIKAQVRRNIANLLLE